MAKQIVGFEVICKKCENKKILSVNFICKFYQYLLILLEIYPSRQKSLRVYVKNVTVTICPFLKRNNCQKIDFIRRVNDKNFVIYKKYNTHTKG